MCGDAGFKERARTGMGGGGGGEVLMWASGYNFPLFLVYPVDMPVDITLKLFKRSLSYLPCVRDAKAPVTSAILYHSEWP